jgi:hypothetical protein
MSRCGLWGVVLNVKFIEYSTFCLWAENRME